MNVVYVLNQSFEVVGVVDDFSSIIWRTSYSDIGDFELYLGASSKALDLLRLNRYLMLGKDSTLSGYKNVMIIKGVELVTDSENGDHLIVTGRELKYILHQRIVWEPANISDTAENAIRSIVTDNAISPSDNARKIPNLILGASAGLTDDIDTQINCGYLDEAITSICSTYNYGWSVDIVNNKLVLNINKAVDRSFAQSDRPYVVFADSFDNLYNTDYQLDAEKYANVALIGGEGEGDERVYTSVGDSSGLARFEMFVDARDLSSNDGEITSDEYADMLRQRGNEKLADKAYTEGFSGEMATDASFVFNRDFFLGDIVTVINSYGINKNVRVVSVIESEDENGYKIIPQFNI